MDKITLRRVAILLLVIGVIAIIIGCIGMSKAKPSRYTTGYMIDGKYVQTGSGKIGGSSKQKSEMKLVRNTGILILVCGSGCMAGSFAMKPGQKIDFK